MILVVVLPVVVGQLVLQILHLLHQDAHGLKERALHGPLIVLVEVLVGEGPQLDTKLVIRLEFRRYIDILCW